MQQLFNSQSTIAHSILRYAEWNYIRAGLKRNLETVKQYYNTRIMAVKSNHLLCRIINTADVSHNLEIERYYDILDTKANAVSNVFLITSPVNKGKLFDGVFYGQGTTEIIISSQESFNPEVVFKDWKNAKPVTVLLHPRSDLNLLLPNGKATSNESGLAVISINIPMLLVQFRGFTTDQLYLNSETSIGLQGVAHFVHRYVLPGLLESHLDIALFNRISNLILGAPMGSSTMQHPFVMPDYTGEVSRIQNRIVCDLQNRSMEYKGMLEMIPAVSTQSMIEGTAMPYIPSTRQITWVETISRLDYLLALIKLGGSESIKLNRSLINAIVFDCRLLFQSNSLNNVLPVQLLLDTNLKMNELAIIAGRPLLNY
jgi:hypothetical protein